MAGRAWGRGGVRGRGERAVGGHANIAHFVGTQSRFFDLPGKDTASTTKIQIFTKSEIGFGFNYQDSNIY